MAGRGGRGVEPDARRVAPADLSVRTDIRVADVESIRRIVASTGFFSRAEEQIAAVLVEERLSRGPASGYEFVLAEHMGQLIGYTCYGPITGTAASYDLYWIVVAPMWQRHGTGGLLLARTELEIRAGGGRRVYVDTSSRPQYQPTRAFYRRHGYREAARLPDFYAPGDGKVILVKVID